MPTVVQKVIGAAIAGTAMAAAALSPEDAETVIQAYDEQAELVRQVHCGREQRG